MSALDTIWRIIMCAAICLLVHASGHIAFAESDIDIRGTVIDDSSGTEIDQALIRIDGIGLSAVSESDGSFELRAVPLGQWSITVERVGYRSRRITDIDAAEGFSRNLHITLVPEPVALPPHAVESPRLGEHGVRRVEVRSEAAGSQSVGELLENIPGVRVYGSGDSPGGTRVSVGGESGSRVAVMLDGLPLSGGSDGAVDLSSIPVTAISAIEVYSGSQSAMAGDAAVGGAVNLITSTDPEPDGVRISSSGAEWGRIRQNVTATQAIGDWKMSVGGEYDQRRNPYKFIDVKSDTVGMRENARLDERRAFLRTGTERSFDLLGYVSRNERGAPGSIEQPLPGAITRNKNGRAQSSQTFTLSHAHTVTTAGWYEFSSEYYNATGARIKQHTYLREHFLGLRLGHVVTSHSTDWNLEIETRYRLVHGDNFQVPKNSFGDEDRTEVAIRTRLNQSLGRFSLRGGMAVDADPDNPPGWSPRVDLGFRPLRTVSLGAGWGRSFKRPLLVTAFWKGDYYTQGNPDLRPERAQEWDASIRWRNRFIAMDSRYFERQIDDIIVWDLRGVPQRFTPVNLASGEVIGREDHVALMLPSGSFSIEYTHVYNDGRDHSGEPNYQGKVIPFMPRHTHDCAIRAARDPVSVLVNARWVSLREALRANSNRWQAPYRVFDAEVRLKPNSEKPHVVVFVRGENLTNEAYELLDGYPSPARTLSGGITIGIE